MPLKDRQAYNAYMNEYMIRRYHQRRSMLIKQLGGACARCTVTEGLEFDHVDKRQKTFNIAKLLASAPMKRIMEEMTNIQLLCQPHHVEKSRECGDYQKKNAGSMV